MAACIFSFRIKKIWRIIECLLIIRSHHTRFNGNCLVCFIKLKNAVHMRIHYQHHTAFNRFESKIYTGAPAIHINRNLLPVAVFHNLLHILFAAWIHHKIRNILADSASKAHCFFSCFPASIFNTGIIIRGYIFFSDKTFKHIYMLIGKLNRFIYTNFFFSQAFLFIKIRIGHLKFFFYHFI